MNSDVIVALISLIGTLGGTFGGIMVSIKLSNYRIEQLEKKVEAHNNLIERVYHLEQRDAVFEEKIETANHRIEDLEQIAK